MKVYTLLDKDTGEELAYPVEDGITLAKWKDLLESEGHKVVVVCKQ